MSIHKCLIRYSAAAAALFWACGAPAQVGVTADKILIGQSAGFTGSIAGTVKELTAGAKAYFDAVNAKGGVHGRKIVLESMDDGFDPKRTPEVIQKLIVEKKVFALFLSRGTPTNEAAIPIIEKYKVPLIGPSTGAMSMYEPRANIFFRCAPATAPRLSRSSTSWSAWGSRRSPWCTPMIHSARTA